MNIPGTRHGSPDAISSLTMTQATRKITEHGGLPIPAHVDRRLAFFQRGVGEAPLKGQSLTEVLRCEHILAVEVTDGGFQMPSRLHGEPYPVGESARVGLPSPGRHRRGAGTR